MSNVAVDALVEKWRLVCAERRRMWDSFQTEINELEAAIKALTGEDAKSYGLVERYDDESLNYIKNTEDGI
jgi:hypothetical protein